MKLGKLPKVHDPRNRMFAEYAKLSVLPTPPETIDWAAGISDFGMLANDRMGDCTIAGAAHQIMIWSNQVHGTPTPIPEQTVVDFYTKMSGGQDTGLAELDVLNTWRSSGFAGHTISAYAEIHPAEVDHVTVATWLFGGLYIGVQLPNSAKGQEVWDVVPSDGGSWGGHCVIVSGISKAGVTVVTWGITKTMTWPFWLKYVEEAYCIIPDDYSQLPLGGIKGVGFDLPALQMDIKSLGGS